ncbi:MAG: acyltransferase family protein [Candidatus Aminicenantes bacterium]|nr:MAG: acyltransferase family protein [Candidatus Aminicenantes bacterium]
MNKQERRYDIDWLRVLAMFSVFLFHCARYFDNEGWHVKNPQLSFGFSVFVGVLVQWIMPIFFVLSGMSSQFALNFRSAGQYLEERFKRLFIPLFFGIFILIPPQVYIERFTNDQFNGSFFQFYPQYFDGWYGFGGNFAWMGLHLWFLLILFLFSLLTLPFLLSLKKKAAGLLIHGFSSFFEKSGTILLWILPLALMEFLFHPDGLGQRNFGGWNVFVYLVFFLYGYLLASDERYKRSVEKQRVIFLALAAITTLIGYYIRRSGASPSFGSLDYFWISLFRSFNSWVWVLAILGIGSRHLTFRNRLLKYGNVAVLPFYILHQSVIVVFGFFFLEWNTAVMPKYLVLSTVSFITIMLVYEFCVKRLGLLRFLFGMKRKT